MLAAVPPDQDRGIVLELEGHLLQVLEDEIDVVVEFFVGEERGDAVAAEPGELRPGRRHRPLRRHQDHRSGDRRQRSGLNWRNS